MFYKSGEKSDLLSYLVTKAVAGWTYMLGFLDCHFRVIYDPREPDEDASVKEKIDSMASAMAQLSPEVEGLFLGLDIDRKSEHELGLQLADLMAGETREFFRSYPEMMSHGATRRIINQLSEEDLEVWDVARPKNLPPMPNKMGALRHCQVDAEGQVLPPVSDDSALRVRRRSPHARHRKLVFVTRDGGRPPAGGGRHERDSERVRAPKETVARARRI